MKIKYKRINNKKKKRVDEILNVDNYDKIITICDYQINKSDIECLSGGDIVEIENLNVLGLNDADNLNLLNYLLNKNIIVNIGGIGTLDDVKLNLIEALFTYEKQKLIDVMNRGKDIAKENGNYREGRKKTYTREVEEYVVKLLNRGNSYREITKMTGVSISTISRIRNNNLSKIEKVMQ